ncbi:WW domain-binding protein 11 [Diabrotica virgifera virgifera]|uniref:WW domain-binding protein 11 n=1 Tax=Diabrotica virgifera virgifera TaxID=50390 RepID=A0A6P7G821_DIAVI|nr:WW domain-binding protein 11 [Diabrotica virgifera virgifera]
MGRRAINTTKSGKYMNPTDQARKEARKQELKKNKKQRQMVRAAVLKGKDPQQILEEMEKIDQMEFNVNQPSPLNEKVLKDKRKKLRDTLDRVLSMYYKDDPEKWVDLKRRQTEYEQKKNQLVVFYESVKSAQQVTVDEIPLPQLPQKITTITNTPAQIPLPAVERKQEHTIYSIATALKLQSLGQPVREPPGCPPGPPPEINDEGEIEEFGTKIQDEVKDAEKKDIDSEETSPAKPTSLQQKMVALSGQNVDEFMKEMETVQKKVDIHRIDEQRAKLTVNIEPLVPPGTEMPNIPSQAPAVPPHIFPGNIRLPPGPPPGRLMPPGPPPGLPPRLPIRLPQVATRMIRLTPPQLIQPVLSAAPQLINRSDSVKQGATISAKPQIRNLSADVTRFVPSALRVKREDKKHVKNPSAFAREMKQKEFTMHQNALAGHTKDDAYKQFMQEMENLL